jgi:hypothetical protein
MTATTALPPAKKSRVPFKRIVRKKSPERDAGGAPKDDDNDAAAADSLFRRSKDVFPEVIREQQEIFKAEKEKGKVKTKPKARRSSSLAPDDEPSSQELKRRKVTQEAVKSDDSDAAPGRRRDSSNQRFVMEKDMPIRPHTCRTTNRRILDIPRRGPQSLPNILYRR